ncbi:DUF222 domain-containing protein [Nocardioides sp. Soil805]|uniref:DUF222 domain-containing protein n=1 Tax=Nocardioides sp. Soil805 TaxID=1736416 RepID=UPI0007031F04|nr:DUF222 domain-containing protein [Nocardioides sp. Soil805]KRF35332.1 hypothetical protein ASG94_14630 [Nocardioides sp. Soil805]
MQLATDLQELTEGALLDHAEAVSRTQRECEVQVLRIAVQHAIINNPARLDPELTRLPGRERAKRFGGVGTPDVAEFCCAELGARLGITSWSAFSLMADALDLVIRLPQLWRRVEALEVKASYARFVARRTRDLTIEQAAYVDSRVAESADGRIPWTRFEELVIGAIAASDPEAAAAREREQARRQLANATRSTEDGMRGFYVRAPFHVIARLDAIVAHLARILADLGDTDSEDQRRVKAVLVLTDPQRAVELMTSYAAWSDRPADSDGSDASARTGARPEVDWDALMPTVVLMLHLYAGGEETGIVRVEGHGPVTEAWLRTHLGEHARFTVRPVLDIAGQAPVDAYEIPDRHRQAVHLMTPADTFPWGSSTSRTQQIDHTVPFRCGSDVPAGQSRVGNYGPMTQHHHRIKTHGAWQVQQPFPGIYVWRDPHGAMYLVDHTGTRRIGTDQVGASPAELRVSRELLGLAA